MVCLEATKIIYQNEFLPFFFFLMDKVISKGGSFFYVNDCMLKMCRKYNFMSISRDK